MTVLTTEAQPLLLAGVPTEGSEMAAVVFPFPGPVLTMMRPRRISAMAGRLILLEWRARVACLRVRVVHSETSA